MTKNSKSPVMAKFDLILTGPNFQYQRDVPNQNGRYHQFLDFGDFSLEKDFRLVLAFK